VVLATFLKSARDLDKNYLPEAVNVMSPKIKESDGEFQVVKASLVLSVPPIFAANPRAGVEELLDSMIMRYIASINPTQNPTISS